MEEGCPGNDQYNQAASFGATQVCGGPTSFTTTEVVSTMPCSQSAERTEVLDNMEPKLFRRKVEFHKAAMVAE